MTMERSTESIAPTRASLLVVDDSLAELELIAIALETAFPAADVQRVTDPLVAKQMCEEHAFDCVLLDYNMQNMDGVTLAGELRALSAHLPIILMTNVGDEMLVARALHSGVTDYIPKSRINVEAVRRCVERSIRECSLARLVGEQQAELENFAYALAHDFKQPIRQIITFSGLISDDILRGEVGGIQKHLTFLSDAARRLGKLVDVMSQYTLLNQAPELADVDLNRALADVRVSIAPFLAERGAEFVTPRRSPAVRGNATLMTQVMQNLVMNGLQYNRSPTPRIEVRVIENPDHCVIEISDNGIGIEAEFLLSIFKPLIRLHTASEFPGSGLGLTLARKAVLSQHGVIWCESTPGVGSVFRVKLPASAASLKASTRAKPHTVRKSAGGAPSGKSRNARLEPSK